MANNSFSEKFKSNTPTLVDFYADWCGPCKTMKPILAEVKSLVGDKASIIKIDVDKNQQVASIYQIKSIPTLILFKNSKPIWRQTGVVSAKTIEQVIKQNL